MKKQRFQAMARVSELNEQFLIAMMKKTWMKIGPEEMESLGAKSLVRADVMEMVFDSLPLVLDAPGKLVTAGRKAFPNLIYTMSDFEKPAPAHERTFTPRHYPDLTFSDINNVERFKTQGIS